MIAIGIHVVYRYVLDSDWTMERVYDEIYV